MAVRAIIWLILQCPCNADILNQSYWYLIAVNMIDLNDSGTRGNITRVDILKMTKQSPHNAAILSKLTHSQLHGI